jgi:hypothetical protein
MILIVKSYEKPAHKTKKNHNILRIKKIMKKQFVTFIFRDQTLKNDVISITICIATKPQVNEKAHVLTGLGVLSSGKKYMKQGSILNMLVLFVDYLKIEKPEKRMMKLGIQI